MSGLHAEQVESLIRRIEFVKLELRDLTQLHPVDYRRYQDDRNLRRIVERIAENVLNACIDIAKILLVSEDEPVPESYRETLRWLGRVGLLPEDDAERLADYAKLRNLLAHEYLDLRWREISDFLAHGPRIVALLVEEVSRKIASQERFGQVN